MKATWEDAKKFGLHFFSRHTTDKTQHSQKNTTPQGNGLSNATLISSLRNPNNFEIESKKNIPLSSRFDPLLESQRILAGGGFQQFLKRLNNLGGGNTAHPKKTTALNPPAILVFAGLFPLYHIVEAIVLLQNYKISDEVNRITSQNRKFILFFGETNNVSLQNYSKLLEEIANHLQKNILKKQLNKETDSKKYATNGYSSFASFVKGHPSSNTASTSRNKHSTLLCAALTLQKIILSLSISKNRSKTYPESDVSKTPPFDTLPKSISSILTERSEKIKPSNTTLEFSGFGGNEDFSIFLRKNFNKFGKHLFSRMHLIESPYSKTFVTTGNSSTTKTSANSLREVLKNFHNRTIKSETTLKYFAAVWDKNKAANLNLLKTNRNVGILTHRDFPCNNNSSLTSAANPPRGPNETRQYDSKKKYTDSTAIFIAAAPCLEREISALQTSQQTAHICAVPGVLPLLMKNNIAIKVIHLSDPGYYAHLHVVNALKNFEFPKDLKALPLLLAPISASALALRLYAKFGIVKLYGEDTDDAKILLKTTSYTNNPVKPIGIPAAPSVAFSGVSLLTEGGYKNIYTAGLNFLHHAYSTHALGYSLEEKFFHLCNRTVPFTSWEQKAYGFARTIKAPEQIYEINGTPLEQKSHSTFSTVGSSLSPLNLENTNFTKNTFWRSNSSNTSKTQETQPKNFQDAKLRLYNEEWQVLLQTLHAKYKAISVRPLVKKSNM